MRRNSGMSLVMAIFLLVILAALGAFIVSLSAVQQVDSGLDLEGSRAYHAARAALEVGAYQAAAANTCVAGAVTVALPAGFGEFANVRLTTVASPNHDEGGVLKTLCTLTANACNQPTAAGVCPNPAPGARYLERELQLSVVNPYP